MNLGAGPIPPQGDQPNRRRKKNKKRRRRSADPGDIEDDINSVTSKLMDKQKKGLDVQVRVRVRVRVGRTGES